MVWRQEMFGVFDNDFGSVGAGSAISGNVVKLRNSEFSIPCSLFDIQLKNKEQGVTNSEQNTNHAC